MKKSDKKQKQEALNLLEMYKLKLTPQRKVEAFRRYVIKLKQQRNFGRDLSYHDHMQADIRLFREEALYMKDLDVEYDMHVRLSKEIRCLEEMSDEQILCYYTLVRRFRENVIERADMFYARYYLLEVANLIYQDTPREACDTMFSFWGALEKAGRISKESREYFDTICRLFMLAFPELMPQMIDRLEEQTGRDWSGRAYEAVEKGDYETVSRFVRQNARSLKESERYPEKEYAVHAWKALPCVFRMLERDLKAYDFRHMILNGFYASVYIGEYPVMCGQKKEQRNVRVSKYMYYEYQDFSDYWKFWYYVLRESVQDLLCVIYQCTESRMRRHLKATPRKGSVNRIISKSYVTGTDRPEDVAKIKELLKDEQFQRSIEDGVLDYLTTEEVSLPERRKRSKKKAGSSAQELDYGEVPVPAAIDMKKLKQAREDAEQVLGMLSTGEIEYETESILSARSFGNVSAEMIPCRAVKYTEQDPGIFSGMMQKDTLRGTGEEKPEPCTGISHGVGVEGTEQEGPGTCSGTSQKKSARRSAAETLTESSQDSGVPVVTWTAAEKQYLRFLRTGDRSLAEQHLLALQMPESVMMKNINQKALELFGDHLLERDTDGIYILEDYEEATDRILGETP